MTRAASPVDLIAEVSHLKMRMDAAERDLAAVRACQLPVNPVERLVVAASKVTGQAPRDITSHRRSQRLSRTRWAVMRAARQVTDASLPEIGAALGRRDRSTVRHGLDQADVLSGCDADFVDLCAAIVAASTVELPMPFGSPVPAGLAAELLNPSQRGD